MKFKPNWGIYQDLYFNSLKPKIYLYNNLKSIYFLAEIVLYIHYEDKRVTAP